MKLCLFTCTDNAISLLIICSFELSIAVLATTVALDLFTNESFVWSKLLAYELGRELLGCAIVLAWTPLLLLIHHLLGCGDGESRVGDLAVWRNEGTMPASEDGQVLSNMPAKKKGNWQVALATFGVAAAVLLSFAPTLCWLSCFLPINYRAHFCSEMKSLTSDQWFSLG